MSLYEELTKIAARVKSQLPQMKNNETGTINVSVLPFIRALGYNTQDLSEVYPEYAILNMDSVDLAVLRDCEPIMILEAKKAGEKLSAKHWKQLFEYFNADKARIGILTNGLEYRFFTDSVKQNIMDTKPSLIINLLELDKVSVTHLDGFTKARFHAEHSLRKIKISNLLDRELRQPSDEFVRYFAKQIHSGTVWQNVIEDFRPIVKQCMDELVDKEIATRLRRHDEPGSDDPNRQGAIESIEPQTSSTSAAIIEVPIFASHKRRRFEGTLLVDEIMNWHRKEVIVRFDGELMSCAAAAKKAVRSLNPARKTGKSGVSFWQFNHPVTGKDLPIKAICEDVQKGGPLRQQLLDNVKG